MSLDPWPDVSNIGAVAETASLVFGYPLHEAFATAREEPYVGAVTAHRDIPGAARAEVK